MKDLQDVIVILGVSHTRLFDGTEGIELILLDPGTGQDFTLPITEEQADIVLSCKLGGQRGETEGLRPNAAQNGVHADSIRDFEEVDQL